MQKLYYDDCHTRSFQATVTGCICKDDGWLVTLSATAFYPEGGGQPWDTGTLDGVPVLSVREAEGEILHLCSAPLAVGATVQGEIHWQRRLDFMQQHTGEHIVSGIIHKRFGYHNVGFHMGSDTVTIDFDGKIPDEALSEIELEANRAVWENLPVITTCPDPEVLSQLSYRSKRALPWPVRIVEIPGFDRCACCGVHVKNTGEIGMIKLLSCVSFHQGVRIEMVCGRRALDLLSKVYAQNRLVCAAFSAKPLETGLAAQQMNQQLSAEKGKAIGLQRQLFDKIAEDYQKAENVLHYQIGLTGGECRELATRIGKHCPGLVAVYSGTEKDGFCFCLVGQAEAVSAMGKRLTACLDAKGGGRNGCFVGQVQTEKALFLSVLSQDGK